MDIVDFESVIGRLHDAYGVDRTTGKAAQVYANKIASWLSMLPDWVDYSQLNRVVKKAIENCERVPSYAELLKIINALPREAEIHLGDWCSRCSGTGVISAVLLPDRKASYAFRCENCENWKGRYDYYPRWGVAYRNQFERVFSASEEMISPDSELASKGISYLEKHCPSLLEKMKEFASFRAYLGKVNAIDRRL